MVSLASELALTIPSLLYEATVKGELLHSTGDFLGFRESQTLFLTLEWQAASSVSHLPSQYFLFLNNGNCVP